MKISSLFSNNMVIQRDVVQCIWGTTTPETQVTGIFGNIDFCGTSNKEGYFKIDLPVLKAGGPYNLMIKADETIEYKDILIGDVFLCGGQSNMEYTMGMLIDRLGFNEVVEKEEYIRSFEVPKVYSFDKVIDELYDSKWAKAQGEDIRSFSAAGFYAAKKLYETTKVPVGLIHCAVGGTPAKSWCRQESIRKMGLYTKELELCLQQGYIKQTEETENKTESDYIKTALDTFNSKDVLNCGTVAVPSLWKTEPLSKLNGTVILKRTFSLTKEQALSSLDLHLGTIRDYDDTYINGVKIGTTDYRYPTRRYHIGSGILKEGENTIQINIIVFRNIGGIDTDKEIFLCPEGTMKSLVDLSGQWQYEIKQNLPTLKDKTFFIYYPSGLYQGMLYPIRNYKVKAAMYYQGESNVGCYKDYVNEMDALISDWRKLFNIPELPFIQVQLAGYCDSDVNNNGDGWAYLRQQQLISSYERNNYLVQAYDIGEYNDLHPWNKKEVGNRLGSVLKAIVCKDLASEKNAMNPEVDKVTVRDNEIHVAFKNIGDGIADCDDVHNLSITNENGIKAAVKGKVKDNALILNAGHAVELSYAWSDCAFDVNLYGKNGLPVIPFKVSLERI